MRVVKKLNKKSRAKFVIVLGGDGTVLKVANILARLGLNIPILGVNFGKRGFLTQVRPDELFDRLLQAIAGEYVVKKRTRVATSVIRGGKTIFCGDALNELAFGRLQDHAVRLDFMNAKTRLELSRGDGYVVSTCAGCHAYNDAANGQAISREDQFVVTVICPTDKEDGCSVKVDSNDEYVVAVDRRVRIKLEVDGKRRQTLKYGDQAVITKSNKATYFIMFNDRT